MHVNYAKANYTEVRHNIKALCDLEGLIESRFKKSQDEPSNLVVVSRFKDKWDKAGGQEV